MSEKSQINDAEIYYDLLLMISDIEEIKMIDISDTADIPSALFRLGLAIKYRMLDLEATRREFDYLKGKNGQKG